MSSDRRILAVYGGVGIEPQIKRLRSGVDILVATPGRLAQFLDSKQLRLDDLRVLVLDEADQLLDPGFLPIVDRALEACPAGMRLAMFAATLPQALEGEQVSGRRATIIDEHGKRAGDLMEQVKQELVDDPWGSVQVIRCPMGGIPRGVSDSRRGGSAAPQTTAGSS